MKTALVLGGGGFIGSHLVNKLKSEGFWVRAVDVKKPDFSESQADDFIVGDLRYASVMQSAIEGPKQSSPRDTKNAFDEVYQLAADMGGAGYIFTGNNDANVMSNSVVINILACQYASLYSVKKIFYSSSACVYPEHNQIDPNNPNCVEDSAYPADPDSEYGWEKLFSERLYAAYQRNYNLNISIGRYHNIYGPESCYDNGKEKVPAAICRKVSKAKDGESIEVWGDGMQTRSFLYIDDCLDATTKLMRSDFSGPVNIGSEEMININDFTKMIINISQKNLSIYNVPGPKGVNGRNSHNKLIKEKLDWQPTIPLENGITKTYDWINQQIHNS
jgi:nucleoside-diphosphate-sugar epimerase